MTADQSVLGERLVAAIFMLLGVGILLPWNAFISAKSYFQSRLCNGGKGAGHEDVELWFGLVFNVSSVVSLGLILGARHVQDLRKAKWREVPTNEGQELPGVFVDQENERNSSCSTHEIFSVVIPLLVYLAVFVITTVMVLIPMSDSTFLRVTLAALALCGLSCAVAGSGVIAGSRKFNSIGSYFSGQAIGGLAVSLSNLVSVAADDPDTFWQEQCQTDDRFLTDDPSASCAPYEKIDWPTFAYFALGCVVLGACIVGYLFVEDSEVAASLMAQDQGRRHLTSDAIVERNMSMSSRSGIELHQQPQHSLEADPQTLAREESLMGDTDGRLKEADASVASNQPEAENETTFSVLKDVQGPAVAIWLTFFVTLALFPSWTSRLESAHKCKSSLRIQNDLFMPITFVLFNAGDLTGRLLAAKVKVTAIHNLSRKLVFAASGRLLFVPLFLVCLATGSAFNEIAVGIDIYSVLIQFVFAVTNGLVVSLAFMHAPSLISLESRVQETSATVLNFALVFGLLCGSLVSFPFIQLATKT